LQLFEEAQDAEIAKMELEREIKREEEAATRIAAREAQSDNEDAAEQPVE